MSLVTIASQDIADWHGLETPAFARLIANQEFVTSENVIVAPGNGFYQQFTCSVVSNKIRIASGQAYSTTDSDSPWGTYTLAIYSAKGQLLTTIAGNLRIPNAPSSTTWTALIEYSQARVQPYRFAFYDTNQINVLLNNYALLADVYTQAQITAILANYALSSQVYTQTQVNSLLAPKLDASKLIRDYLEIQLVITNNATLADTNLTVNLEAGGIYAVRCEGQVTAGAGGCKTQLGGTHTRNGLWMAGRSEDSTGTIVASQSDTFGAALSAGALTSFYRYWGTIEVANAGTFLLQAAQNSSNAAATSFVKNAFIIATKLN